MEIGMIILYLSIVALAFICGIMVGIVVEKVYKY